MKHNLKTENGNNAEIMRIIRNQLLAQSDWTQLPDAQCDQAAWATYRQALRDFPATWKPAETANFPEAPA
jgi:hypothetical protein